jgi:hypothetical protein
MPLEPTTGDMIEIAVVAALAVALAAAVLEPPFLLFRSLARRRRSHLPGALRQPGDTRP